MCVVTHRFIESRYHIIFISALMVRVIGGGGGVHLAQGLWGFGGWFFVFIVFLVLFVFFSETQFISQTPPGFLTIP